MVFGHRKCSGGYRVYIGSLEGVPDTPAKDIGLMGQEGKRTSHKGLVCPPYGPAKVEKERGRRKGKKGNRIPPSFPLHPLSFPFRYIWQGGARLGRSPSRIRSYLGRLLASPLPLPPIYMWERGA